MKFRLIESFENDKVTGYPWKSFIKNEEGTHGKFKTKKEADAQRKAMFANGFKESLGEPLKEDSWQSRKARIDKNKLNQLCAYIFGDEEVEPADSYMNFKYKDNYLLAATVMDGFQNSSNSVIERDQDSERLIRKRAKERGVRCRIEVEYHRERFDVIEGLVIRLMIPYELISK